MHPSTTTKPLFDSLLRKYARVSPKKKLEKTLFQILLAPSQRKGEKLKIACIYGGASFKNDLFERCSHLFHLSKMQKMMCKNIYFSVQNYLSEFSVFFFWQEVEAS